MQPKTTATSIGYLQAVLSGISPWISTCLIPFFNIVKFIIAGFFMCAEIPYAAMKAFCMIVGIPAEVDEGIVSRSWIINFDHCTLSEWGGGMLILAAVAIFIGLASFVVYLIIDTIHSCGMKAIADRQFLEKAHAKAV